MNRFDERFFVGICFILFMSGTFMGTVALLVDVFNHVGLYVYIVLLLTVGSFALFVLYMALNIIKLLYDEYF